MSENRNRSVVQNRVGLPEEAVDLISSEMPVPGDGELLVELVIAPINPAEVLMLRGQYGYRESVPPVPRAAGIEGVGRVIGGALDQVPAGSLVSLAGARAIFSDYIVLDAEQALVLDPDIDVEAFALGFVNTQSVLLMLHEWPEVERKDWIVQNAGNSGYGRILDAVAHRRGIGVVNVVRSEAAAESIRATAHGPVVVDADDLDAAVLSATGGVRPLVAVDAVGGASTGRLAETVAAGGRVVTYGIMSGEEIQVDTRLVLFNGIRLEGFWMPRSMGKADPGALADIAQESLEIVRAGEVQVPIESRFPLDQVAQAMARAAEGGRRGKVVLIR